MHARLVQPPTIARRAAIAALLVVLVLAQTLGWIHRALHGDPPGSGRPVVVAAASEPAPGASAHGGVLHDLFGSHAEPTDCRLFDVLGQPGCATPPLVLPPVILPAARVALSHADFVARWAALFDARGPPATR